MPVVNGGSSQPEMEILVLVLLIASVMKEKMFERVLWDVARCELKEGRERAAEDSLIGNPTTGRPEPPSLTQ